MIASHYSEPLEKHVTIATALHAEPDYGSEVLAELEAGDAFHMLDNSVGWAWGYAGPDRLVGYIPSSALGA